MHFPKPPDDAAHEKVSGAPDTKKTIHHIPDDDPKDQALDPRIVTLKLFRRSIETGSPGIVGQELLARRIIRFMTGREATGKELYEIFND